MPASRLSVRPPRARRGGHRFPAGTLLAPRRGRLLFRRSQVARKQAVSAATPAPLVQQFHGCPGDATLTPEGQRPPFGGLGADAVDELHPRPLGPPQTRAPVDEKVHGGASAGLSLWRIVLRNTPIFSRSLKRRVEDRLRAFVRIQGSTPNARQIWSSFSTTSGWISSGSITAAISR